MKECRHTQERRFRVDLGGELALLCAACKSSGRFAVEISTYPKAPIDNRALAHDVDDLLALREEIAWLCDQVTALEEQLIRDLLALHENYNTDFEYLSWGDIARFMDVKSNYLKALLNARNTEKAVVGGGLKENRAKRAAAIRKAQQRRAKSARSTRVGSGSCDSDA